MKADNAIERKMGESPESSPPKYLSEFSERQDARMRLPVWLRYLMPLLVMSFVLALTVGCVVLLWSLHRALHPEISLRTLSKSAGILMFVPPFFGAMAPAMMLLNLLLHRIPPLRKIFEKNCQNVPGTSYREAITELRKAAVIIVPPALALALLGAIEPWAF